MSDLSYEPDSSRVGDELQQFAIFSVCVVGKNADTVIDCVRRFVRRGSEMTGEDEPFEIVRRLAAEGSLVEALKLSGIGCYTHRARTLTELAMADFDLRTCSVQDLETIWGIGPKTARFFVLFSRDNVDDIAVLDVHILRWLREQGHDVPQQTPGSTKRYREIEQLFLKHVPEDVSLAQFDYELWLKMRQESG